LNKTYSIESPNLKKYLVQYFRSLPFGDFTQRRLIVYYRYFGTTRHIFEDPSSWTAWPSKMDQYVVLKRQ